MSVISNTYGSKGPKSCLEIMALMFKKGHQTKLQQLYQRLTLNVTDVQKRQLFKKAVDAEFSPGQIDHFIAGINGFGNRPVDFTMVDSYLQFVKSLPKKRREAALLVISEINSSDSQSKFIRQFHKILKDLDKFEKKELLRFNKQLDPRLAKKKALVRKQEYQKIIFGCRAGGWTPARKNGARQFKYFILGIGGASTLASYSYNHSDEDINGEWFGKLGYELTMSVVTGWLTAKIISNPASSNIRKGVLSYFVGRPISLADTRVYAYLFSISQKEAEKKLAEILKNPEYQKEINELIKFLDEKRIYQQYKESILIYARKMLRGFGVAPHKPLVSPSTIDWQNLSKEDLQNEPIHDLLIAAVLAASYEDQTGEWITTGDKGYDRFSFYLGYSLLTLPPAIYVNLLIYRTLCLGALNPTRAMMKGVGIYALNRIVFDQIQFYFRKKAINQ